MPAGQTTISGTNASGTTVTILAGSDGTNVAPSHTNYDVNGVPIGTTTNPFVISVVPFTLTSRSVSSSVAATSTSLVTSNTSRRIFRVQAPQTAELWLNLVGGTAGPNLLDCLHLNPGDIYETNDANAITYYCATASLVISAWEG